MTAKKMAYLSVRNIESEPLLWFEIEDYNDHDRLGYADVSFASFQEEEMLHDQESLWVLGKALVRGFLLTSFLKPGFRGNKEGKSGALAIYTNADPENSRIFIDEEPYVTNPLRRFHTSVPLQSLVMSEVRKDTEFCKRIAAITVKMLMPDVPFESDYLRWRTFSEQ